MNKERANGEKPKCVSLREYLDIHLREGFDELFDGEFSYEDVVFRSITPDELVNDILMDIDETAMEVKKKEKDVFIFSDNPTREDRCLLNLQKELREEGVFIDYEALDYVFKRCLYAYVTYGFNLVSPPRTELELADFEERYLREDLNIEVEGVMFSCSVKSIPVGPRVVYQRKWVIIPPESPDL